jgi:hypothetical protein
VIALLQVASEVRRAARLDVPYSPGLTGEQAIPEPGAIRRSVEAENVRHLQHEDLGEGLEVLHELVEGLDQ